jgi:serine/threonine-protein kinase RsbT
MNAMSSAPFDRGEDGPRMILHGSSAAERFTAARWVRSFGQRVGLTPKRSEELALAASELVSNVTRHAESGWLEFRVVRLPRPHVLLVCGDRGPGIADLTSAQKDGYSQGVELTPDASRKQGLGMGLGAVARLVDELTIATVVDVGTTVTVRKFIP